MGKTLYILAGGAMLELFKENNLIDPNNDYISFNEAMCDGPRCSGVFSDTFIHLRALAHLIKDDEYRKISIDNLYPLLEDISFYHTIVLVFGKDMFCQINMLTILTYLSEIGYPYDIRLLIVNDRTLDVIKQIKVNSDDLYNYRELYETGKPHPTNTIMNSAFLLYHEYKREDNEIMREIKRNVTKPLEQMSDSELTYILTKLYFQFEDYGLGDTQYVRMFKHLHQIGEI